MGNQSEVNRGTIVREMALGALNAAVYMCVCMNNVGPFGRVTSLRDLDSSWGVFGARAKLKLIHFAP